MNTTETTNAAKSAAAAEQAAPVTPKKVSRKKATTAKPKANTRAKGAKKASTKKATAAGLPREFSKKAIVIDILKSKGGATMAEIQKATGWQAHSIRGFVSGTLNKKMGLKVERTTNDAKESVYRIAK